MATRSSQIETPNLPIFHRQPLSLRVTEILKRYILVEPLETGSRLPAERRLAETLSVSRTVLREALSQLIVDGILVRATPRTLSVAPFDRLRVAAELAPLNDYDIVDQSLIELRVIIEVGAIELITRRADADDLDEIERWVTAGERSVVDSAELMGRVDLHFHTTLLQSRAQRRGQCVPSPHRTDHLPERRRLVASPRAARSPGGSPRRGGASPDLRGDQARRSRDCPDGDARPSRALSAARVPLWHTRSAGVSRLDTRYHPAHSPQSLKLYPHMRNRTGPNPLGPLSPTDGIALTVYSLYHRYTDTTREEGGSMAGTTLVHVGIRATDLDRTIRFWRDALGLRVVATGDGALRPHGRRAQLPRLSASRPRATAPRLGSA